LEENKWIHIDVFFLVSGFPLTCELSQDIIRRLKNMGYEIRNPKILERHESRINDYFRHRDGVHTEKPKVKIYKTVG